MGSSIVTIICPNLRCRSVLQVPDGVRGQRVRCGRCGRDFIVPAVGPKPPRPEPAIQARKPNEAEAPHP